MLTAIAQSVEISTLKTSACLPIQIRIRRSTSGQTVRLRNAMASASQTSAVDRRCWKALPRYVTCAPMLIGQQEHPDTLEANSRYAADQEFSKRAARDVRFVEPILRRLLVPVGEACAICHLSRPSSETCWVLVIGTQRKTKDRERCRCAGGWKSGREKLRR